MKCSVCHIAVGDAWMLVTEGYVQMTRTMIAHPRCFESVLGRNSYRELRGVIGSSGWQQEQLPGFRPSDLVPQ